MRAAYLIVEADRLIAVFDGMEETIDQ